MTINEMQKLLAEVHGAKIITLISKSNVDLKKEIWREIPSKDFRIGDVKIEGTLSRKMVCPYIESEIIKIVQDNGVINFSYKNAMDKALGTKNFKPQKRKWGTKLDGIPFVSHINKDGENKLYLEMKLEKRIDENYFIINEDSTISSLEKDWIEPWIKPKKEQTVALRNYAVENIIALKSNKEVHILNEVLWKLL